MLERVENHNTPFNDQRRRLGALRTVYGQPWIVWGYVRGFEGQNPRLQLENAMNFERRLTGNEFIQIHKVTDLQQYYLLLKGQRC